MFYKPLFFILLFIHLDLRSQNQEAFIIDSLPPQGILLDRGWKFQLGDHAEWASTDFDDKNWSPIDPTTDVHELTQIPKGGIGWFRIHLRVDTNILKKQLALIIQQSGASEIYLNGILIHRFGIISSDPKKIKGYDPLGIPVLFPLNKTAHHVLALRYGLQANSLFTTLFETKNPVFSITVNDFVTALVYKSKMSSREQIQRAFTCGVSFWLVIMHLAFYFYYPSKKANLYFSLFGLFFLVPGILAFFEVHTTNLKFYHTNIAMALIQISYFSLLTAIYSLFDWRKDNYYWALLGLVIFSFFLNAMVYGWGWRVGGQLMQILVLLNIARMALLSLKKGKRGAGILVAGAAICLLSFIVFIGMGAFSIESFGEATPFRIILFSVFALSIPAATSIYLGVDFAFTNQLIKQKLIEVETLSAKTISQEQEKQQILASQNIILEQQVLDRTAALSQSLQDLKQTQSQLIQSEKMASLGELTAGIAHEIQNPLNFVNNFSDVNTELIDEIKQAVQRGNPLEIIPLLTNLRDNEEKIRVHGQRADAIVKSMLQHSRVNTGKKELTDINALADEYLRLSYHAFQAGLRTKDKALPASQSGFNANLVTHLDPEVGKINIVSQDIGRVLLNLYNNAFYAVQEKFLNQGTTGVQEKYLNRGATAGHQKFINQDDVKTGIQQSPGEPDGQTKSSFESYHPTVTVGIKKINSQVEISVKDNGTGIPEPVREKIFQPFFTTKPAGQGTGLGLSLAYDIVKSHQGTLQVEAIESGGTEFKILLPI